MAVQRKATVLIFDSQKQRLPQGESQEQSYLIKLGFFVEYFLIEDLIRQRKAGKAPDCRNTLLAMPDHVMRNSDVTTF